MTPPFYHYVFDISFLSLVLDGREGMGTKYYSQTYYLKKVIVRYLFSGSVLDTYVLLTTVSFCVSISCPLSIPWDRFEGLLKCCYC